jgi:regulator of RNase E activity RraA
VIADGSGVVFIAAGRAEEVIAAAESIAAHEAEMRDAVLAGRSVVEVMGAGYESMLNRG